jgi:mRNA interferase RelE/StbE
MYQVIIARPALKQLKKIPRAYSGKISEIISSLATTPDPKNAKQLTNRIDRSIRVGVYRILYRVDRQKVMVLVIHVGHRKDVYKK